MRLISRTFLFAMLLCSAAPAIAQPTAGVSYTPPPVDYADAPAPVAAPVPVQVEDAGVSYAPPAVDYVDPGNASRQAAPTGQDLLRPEAQVDTSRPGRHRRVDVSGYVAANVGIETGDLLGNDDTLTYSSVAAGVDGTIQTRRVTASFGYRYDRSIELSGNAPDQDTHTGIAQVRAELIPNVLSLEAAGLAARTGGAGRAIGTTRREPGAQVVTAYAGPELATRTGPLNINAYYRLGYTHVDDDTLAGSSPEGSFSATTHMAGASIGRAPGNGSIGWGVSAGHLSEVAGSFATHTSIQWARGDVSVPVNPTLALMGGVGYARERGSERDFLRDGSGAPVLNANGELIANPAAARVSTLDVDGIYADVGFIYRPTRRSEFELHVGVNAHDDPVVYGQAHAQVGHAFGFGFTLYDNDQTFGGSLQRNLRELPDTFQVRIDPLTGGLATGCVFSRTDYGRGVCISPALQSLSTAAYRNRGGAILWSGGRRMWTIGGGVTYNRRDFYRGDSPLLADYFAPSDEDLAVFGSLARRLGRTSDLDLSTFFSMYSTDDITTDDITTLGGRATYTRSFLLSRLQAVVGVGLTYRSYSISPETLAADVLLGLTYTF